MKNIFRYGMLFIGMSAMLTSCEDEITTDGSLSRLFTPTKFETVTPTAGGVVLSWASSKGATSYTLELAADSSFTEVLHTQDGIRGITYEFANIGFKSKYVARVSAQAEGMGSSKTVLSKGFTTLSRWVPTVLKEVNDQHITLSKALLEWDNSQYTVTHLRVRNISVPESEAVMIELTEEQKVAGEALLEGLSEATMYEVMIIDSNIEGEMGEYNAVTFKTKSGALPTDIILTPDDILKDVLAEVAEGSTLYLPAGAVYNNLGEDGANASLILSKSVIFRGAPEGDKPMLNLKEINIAGNLDLIRFENVKISGAFNGTVEGSYMINLRSAESFSGIGALQFVDCEISDYKNAVLRNQAAAGTFIKSLEVNNCLIYDINPTGANGYAIFHFADKDYVVEDYKVLRTTIYNCGTSILENRQVASAMRTTNVLIEDCTFNNLGNNTRYLLDFQNYANGTMNIRNTIFGTIQNPEGFSGLRTTNMIVNVSNSYLTADHVVKGGAIKNATQLSESAAQLFINPLEGNFSFLPGKELNAGAPRWK